MILLLCLRLFSKPSTNLRLSISLASNCHICCIFLMPWSINNNFDSCYGHNIEITHINGEQKVTELSNTIHKQSNSNSNVKLGSTWIRNRFRCSIHCYNCFERYFNQPTPHKWPRGPRITPMASLISNFCQFWPYPPLHYNNYTIKSR